MGRHRHAVNVRADGLATVLGPLLRDPRVRAATLVDVDSGMVLDACAGDGSAGDLEMLGAGHAELIRVVLVLLSGPECEVVVGTGGDRHHVARVVPDPHGDRLALSVVVDGPRRAADRTLKRLRRVSAAALTAGPTMTRRPAPGGWPLPSPVPPSPVPRQQFPTGPPAPRRPVPGPVPAGVGVQSDPAINLFAPPPAAIRRQAAVASRPPTPPSALPPAPRAAEFAPAGQPLRIPPDGVVGAAGNPVEPRH